MIYLQMIESEDDKSKFEQIYISYRDTMLKVAMHILGNEQDAEDAVHQSFLAIINNLDKFSEVKSPKTKSYVIIITERKAIDRFRERSRFVDADLTDAVDDKVIPLPGDDGIADAMARLPARYREVLLLRFDNGYSSREIAKLLGIEGESAQKLIWRAKKALKEELEREEARHERV